MGPGTLFPRALVFPHKVPGGVPMVNSDMGFLFPPLTLVLLVGHFPEQFRAYLTSWSSLHSPRQRQSKRARASKRESKPPGPGRGPCSPKQESGARNHHGHHLPAPGVPVLSRELQLLVSRGGPKASGTGQRVALRFGCCLFDGRARNLSQTSSLEIMCSASVESRTEEEEE